MVWGCKPPELLLTEGAAFHNRGVADTQYATPSKATRETSTGDGTSTSPYAPANPDMDQVRVPQGSLFIELYCTRSPTNQTRPDRLVHVHGHGRMGLDVARVAPDGTPVWRIVVSKSRITDPNSDVSARVLANPDSSAIEPEQYPGDPNSRFSLLSGGSAANVSIDRPDIFLTTTPPPATVTGASTVSFYNYGANSTRSNANMLSSGRYLPGGQYLVLGPRGRTYIGTKVSTTMTNVLPSSQYIDLVTGAGVSYVNNGGTPVSPQVGAAIKQPYTMILASPPPTTPTAWSAHPHGIGLNLSEPLYSSGYYYDKEPTSPGPDDFTTCGDDPGWYDKAKVTPEGTFVDRPMETTQLIVPAPTPAQNQYSQFRPLVVDAKTPAGKGLLQTGTTLNYKTLFLQRLANPSQPYNSVTNPYRTVDWLPVDLTVFNGTDFNTQLGTHGWNPATKPSWMLSPGAAADGKHATYAPWDYDDPTPTDTNPVAYMAKTTRFGSRQRGGSAATASALQSAPFSGYFTLNPWTQILVNNQDVATTFEPTSANKVAAGRCGRRGHGQFPLRPATHARLS